MLKSRIVGGLLAALLAAPLQAQTSRIGAGEVSVNSEIERYLRVIQVAGVSDPYPWTLRAFLDREIATLQPPDSAHPWATTTEMDWAWRGLFDAEVVAPTARTIYNSAFAYGVNDGAVWAGRGLTGVLEGGVRVRAGRLTAVLRPVWFRTQNREFALAETNPAIGVFADPRRPNVIDLPQRFGDTPYGRLDPGQSSVQVDLQWLAAGVSTANEHWGPAREYPILMGNNAAGFRHVFLGSSRPLAIGIGRLHARAFWGQLGQSDFSPVDGPGSRRLATALAVTYLPRGIPGLELGAARIHHGDWPDDGISWTQILQPLEHPFDGNQGVEGARNQLASVYFRWVFPRSGAEVYAEYGREDYNKDLRDLLLEPDHISAYTAGLVKTWRLRENVLAAGLEVTQAQVNQLEWVRNQSPMYIHSGARQGHTQLGQLLGSPAIYGGSGAKVTLDYYRPSGRLSAYWGRELRGRAAEFRWVPERDSSAIDTQQAFGAEALVWRGAWEAQLGAALIQNLDRNLRGDEANLVVRAGMAWHP